jgi:hypothetical protein
MAEFPVNKQVLQATGILPFFVTYRLNPKIDFEPDIPVDNPEEG